MQLPLKLSRSTSKSPPSSTPPSTRITPCASPAPAKEKPRFSLLGRGRRTSKPEFDADADAVRISESSTRAFMPVLPSSKVPPGNNKGRSSPKSACNSVASSPEVSAHMGSTSLAAAEDEMLEMKQVFAQFDANGDGRISTEELHAVLVCLGETATMEEAAMMVREVDSDGDGCIDLEEFVEINRQCAAECALEEEMAAAFAMFDPEKTGRITAEGLQQLLQRLGGRLAQSSSVEDCRQMIRSVDRKGSGHVDFEDFKRLMTPPLVF